MSQLIIPGTKSTPEAHFSIETNTYSIKGLSTPMQAMEFYGPVIQWINSHQQEIPDQANFEFELPYFNSASMKTIMMVLQAIQKGKTEGKQWKVSWIVEDDDEFMLDAAESFQELLEFEFDIVNK